jgi:hypothetical protein
MDGKVTKWIILAIGVVILLSVVAGVIPSMNLALNNVSQRYNGTEWVASGVPLSSIFTGNGLIMLVIMAGILIAVVFSVLKYTKK